MNSWIRFAAAVKRGDPARAAIRRGRRLLPASPGELALVPGGRRVAREVRAPDLHDEVARAVELVLERLDGCAPVLGPAVPRRARRVAVRDCDLEHLRTALEGLPAWCEVSGFLHSGGRIAVRPRLAVDSRLLPAPPELGVVVDVMTRHGEEYRGNGLAAPDRIPSMHWEEVSRLSLLPERRLPCPPAPDVEIDLVYTWVDGSDPAWRGRRDTALAGVGDSHPSAVVESRFADSEELRHSLRSVHRYANWVRRIHLVTDDQIPSWLDVDHPRIHLVTHRELIGESRFNSHALEASLHRIPGLAEHYLYLNDDVFFGDLAHPGDFFAAPGISRFFPSDLPIDPGPASPADRPIMAAAKNGRDLLGGRFGIEVRTRMRHTVHPQLRSVAEQIETEHPEEVERTRAAAFRSTSDLSFASSLHHWYAHALGKAVPAEPNYLYVDLGASDVGQTLDALESLRRYDTFCLNQEDGPMAPGVERDLARFFDRYLPHAAPWEKSLDFADRGERESRLPR